MESFGKEEEKARTLKTRVVRRPTPCRRRRNWHGHSRRCVPFARRGSSGAVPVTAASDRDRTNREGKNREEQSAHRGSGGIAYARIAAIAFEAGAKITR